MKYTALLIALHFFIFGAVSLFKGGSEVFLVGWGISVNIWFATFIILNELDKKSEDNQELKEQS